MEAIKIFNSQSLKDLNIEELKFHIQQLERWKKRLYQEVEDCESKIKQIEELIEEKNNKKLRGK